MAVLQRRTSSASQTAAIVITLLVLLVIGFALYFALKGSVKSPHNLELHRDRARRIKVARKKQQARSVEAEGRELHERYRAYMREHHGVEISEYGAGGPNGGGGSNGSGKDNDKGNGNGNGKKNGDMHSKQNGNGHTKKNAKGNGSNQGSTKENGHNHTNGKANGNGNGHATAHGNGNHTSGNENVQDRIEEEVIPTFCLECGTAKHISESFYCKHCGIPKADNNAKYQQAATVDPGPPPSDEQPTIPHAPNGNGQKNGGGKNGRGNKKGGNGANGKANGKNGGGNGTSGRGNGGNGHGNGHANDGWDAVPIGVDGW